MVPMKMTSISVSYINMVNYSTPPRSKNETVIKFKRPIHNVGRSAEDYKTRTAFKRNSGYADGEIYAKHALFSRHRISLRLHLCTDEFEVANPLRSKKGKHDQVAFYFTFGNLPTRFNSQLSHIPLCLLAKYSLLQKMGFSYSDILQPIINDLKI